MYLINSTFERLTKLSYRDFGWGLPKLPCIAGRDFAGKVAIAPKSRSRFKKGDNVRFQVGRFQKGSTNGSLDHGNLNRL